MLLFRCILSRLFVPAIKGHLPQAVPAGITQYDPPLPQQIRRHPDAVSHIVVGLLYPPAPLPQGLDEAGRRRVHDHPLDLPPRRQPLQHIRVLRVGFLPSLPAGIVIDLLYPVPNAVPFPPKTHRQRIHRPVIHGYPPPAEGPLRHRCRISGRVEKVIHQALSRRPFSLHEPSVKHARIQPLIPLPDLRRQAGIIRHRKVQPQHPPALRLLDPLLVKPVFRPLWIAIEPQLAALDAAPGHRLLYKRPWHQRRLVQQQSRQCAPLDQRRAGLVFPAKQQKLIPLPAKLHHQGIGAPVFTHDHTDPPQAGDQFRQQIPPQRPHRLAAQGKLPSVKTTLGPQKKRQSHAKRLSAADCPIADDGLPTVLPPPGQHLPLLAGKPDHIISHSSLPFPPAAPPAPEAADPPAGVRWPPTASTASLTPGPGPPA